MKATITPSTCQGEVFIPPSKSMSHRAIICACLSDGKSRIDNIAYSQDITTTIDGMKLLGANIECFDDYLIVDGIKDFNHLSSNLINCNESGSTLRFFIPLFAATGQPITFVGKNRLLKRPQKIYETLFKEQNCLYEQEADAINVHGALKPGKFTLPGNVSSQFISGLLFLLPLLNEDSTIVIENTFESRSYVDLTVQMLEEFQVEIKFLDDSTIFIKGNQKYIAHDTRVEGDFSQFAFFAVLAAINHDLTIQGVNPKSLQGDKQILQILRDFQIPYEQLEHGYIVHQATPMAADIDLANCPDLGPILCVLAMNAQGTTHIKNAARLRIKESDRIEAMETELKKFGANISSVEDEITIVGGWNQTPSQLIGWKDHRIVMALSVASSLCESAVEIEEAEYIDKSYPTFFDDCNKVNIEVVIHD